MKNYLIRWKAVLLRTDKNFFKSGKQKRERELWKNKTIREQRSSTAAKRFFVCLFNSNLLVLLLNNRAKNAMRILFVTVNVEGCRMSDGSSTVGHATGIRAIVRGCNRAKAQGAVKSVVLPDGYSLVWSYGVDDAWCCSSFPVPWPLLILMALWFSEISGTARTSPTAYTINTGQRLDLRTRFDRYVIFEPRERERQITGHDNALYACTIAYV